MTRKTRTFAGIVSAPVLMGILAAVCGCVPGAGSGGLITRSFDFEEGAQGWQAGFADYPIMEEPDFLLDARIEALPDELGLERRGFLLAGTNHSDDLFMFVARALGPDDGIVPGRAYRVSFTIAFASNAPTGCAGVGGAPGESVLLKAGATPVEPHASPDESGFVHMNVDKGNQAEGGPAASVVGDIANGIDCADVSDLSEAPYVLLERTHEHDTVVTAGDDGVIWVLVGIDSGFESQTAVYFRGIEVRLRPVP